MKIIDDSEIELDANFDLEISGSQIEILWESRGGSDHGPRQSRNKDYAPAIEILFKRLGMLNLMIDEIQIASSVALKKEPNNRTLFIQDFPYPLEMKHIDEHELRLALGRASAAFGRKGNYGGNPTKKILIKVSGDKVNARVLDAIRLPSERQKEIVSLKYTKLGERLSSEVADSLTLSMSEIESYVGELPKSAKTHQFWANSERHHNSRRRQWLDAGFQAFYQSDKDCVRFVRIQADLEYEFPTDNPEELIYRAQTMARRYKKVANAVSVRPSGSDRPSKVTVIVNRFSRDPNVIGWVLSIAQDSCEVCDSSAPFQREDGSAFLEVHHLRPLAEGGPDLVENAVACCPNCHRELHFGRDREKLKRTILQKITRLKNFPFVERDIDIFS